MPRPKVAMRRIKEVLRLKEGLGLSDTAVSRSVRIARSTVKEYLDRAAAAGLNWETVAELSEEELDRRLFAAVDTRHWDRPLPDWEAVEKELRGRGVTLRLLWLEYLSRHPEGYRYTQFCALATFLGHKITPQLAQEIGSQFATRIEGTCVKHRFSKSSIKIYDKFDLALRIETTTNDVSAFKHYRKVEHRQGPGNSRPGPRQKDHLQPQGLA